jgi:hypothetical protein
MQKAVRILLLFGFSIGFNYLNLNCSANFPWHQVEFPDE